MSEAKCILPSKQQTLIERLEDCIKVTFSAGLHGVEADCKEAAAILKLQYAAETTRAMEAVEAQETIKRLRGALEMMYDKWENGDPCYTDTEDLTGYIGHAFNLTDAEEKQVLALIPQFPSEKRQVETCPQHVGAKHPGCPVCYPGLTVPELNAQYARIINVPAENGT